MSATCSKTGNIFFLQKNGVVCVNPRD
ncbi:MAG: hypothetical protein EAZ37_01865 [Burkholderiales bacterium]|nr:MAG: hypothetical protein EAZ43_06825 [Betaproteobacteria bacterium]TAG28323.1 MAG: hypothetical protein EAZ37_01865 [Burkholderiales bacterium]